MFFFSRLRLSLGNFSELFHRRTSALDSTKNVSPDEPEDDDVPHREGGVPGAGDQRGGDGPHRLPAALHGQRLRDAPVPGSHAAAATAAVRADAAADGASGSAAADGATGDVPGLPAEPAAPERQQPGLGPAAPAAVHSEGERNSRSKRPGGEIENSPNSGGV